MSKIDLHMHSTYSSDGEFPPGTLMELCAAAGVTTAALTDHNSTRGVAEAKARAAQLGLELIPAIELDCRHESFNLHLLGYRIDPDHPVFTAIETATLAMERATSQERVRKILDLGIVLDTGELDQLAFHGIITGEMIAEVALKQAANRSNPLLQPFYSGGSRSDNPYVNFYWDFCAQGKPAYVPVHYMPLAEGVAAITAAGGIPVLAHPGNNIGLDEAWLASIIGTGVRGVEVFSSYHDPEASSFFQRMAEKFNLAMTCGSDFHGKTKPSIQIGSVPCDHLEQEILDRLRSQGSVG